MVNFIPKFFGADGDSMMMENMMINKNMCKTYVADLKIGTSTVTMNCKKDKEKLKRRIQKDAATTSQQLGFKFTGYEFKNLKTGKLHSKMVKKPFLSISQTKLRLF